jgi:hypothetical protein
MLFNIHLNAKPQQEYVIELSLADEDLEQLLEEEEKRMEELANADPIESHMAFNETAKPSFGNPEPLKTLDELMQEMEQSEENSSDENSPNAYSDFGDSLKELAKKREELKQKLGEKEAQKKEFTNNLAKRRTSVSYSLVDRTSYSLPPPIYTCIEGGKVVVNIEVDALGNVVRADFNARSSNTSNGCLVDNAISYAFRAQFTPGSEPSQIGTITYIFQSK